MCYHNSLKSSKKEIEERYKAVFAEPDLFEPYYHSSGFGHPKWPIITQENKTEISLFNWGLVPFWTKDKATATDYMRNNLNAKSESIFEKKSFTDGIKSKRCLVASTGFFEWRHIGKNKYPYFIHLKKEPIFSMAGIYSYWKDKETGIIYNSFSILTSGANDLMAKIHNSKERMPLIVPKDFEDYWLSDEITKEDIENFFDEYNLESSEMNAFTINKKTIFEKEVHNSELVFEKVDYEEIQAIESI